jgi:hypothetical protein
VIIGKRIPRIMLPPNESLGSKLTGHPKPYETLSQSVTPRMF